MIYKTGEKPKDVHGNSKGSQENWKGPWLEVGYLLIRVSLEGSSVKVDP